MQHKNNKIFKITESQLFLHVMMGHINPTNLCET